MDYKVYLQGSYPNHTNIRGDSDVDVVFEGTSTMYHNVPEGDRWRYNFGGRAPYTWQNFRDEVEAALRSYYGSHSVTSRSKCISVAGSGDRLNADVIPCTTYHHYFDPGSYAKGITFWTRTGIQVVNYPGLHKDNGAQKNQSCSTRYKPNIRMFKNARNKAKNDFPSYFLECLLFNVPDACYEATHAATYCRVVDYLVGARRAGTLSRFECQNRQQLLFGTELHQADFAAAEQLIADLHSLWTQWRVSYAL